VKETGIIMSGDHPLKVRDGTKTMTRRVIKPQPDFMRDGKPCIITGDQEAFERYPYQQATIDKEVKCPYGQVGDRLWVRETWYVGKGYDGIKPRDLPVPAVKDSNKQYITIKKGYTADRIKPNWSGQTRASRFMPRWASRITLEITEVRAELLRMITPADAMAEGGYTVEEFIEMYLKLNHLPKDTNPLNWAISFRRLD